MEGVTLIGASQYQYADTLRFSTPDRAYNMQRHALASGTLEGRIYGGGGNDAINGSDLTNDYTERLYGEGDNDTIDGMYGDDYLDGGFGNDTMLGGPGDDEMYGGDGNDTMSGNLDDDVMYGDAGADFMSGGAGDDTIDGGTGGDVMCGDSNTAAGDVIYDGDPNGEGALSDRIWGAESADRGGCDSTSTQSDSTGTYTLGSASCTTTLGSRPIQCP